MTVSSKPSNGARILVALQNLRNIGPKRGISALAPYGNVIESEDPEYLFAEVAGNLGCNSSEHNAVWNSSRAIISKCMESEIGAVSLFDPDYPVRLSSIENPPPVLYVKGSHSALDIAKNTLVVAIVGTRHPTDYGSHATRKLTRTAVEHDATVVSGLAYGCDTLAHQACVDANGTTVAVLAQGLDTVYPKSNSALANKILDEGGCLVSEHFPGAKVGRWAFAARDRIQSGLSDCVLAIETEINGGTMHTVEFARSQGRCLGCLLHPRTVFSPDSIPDGNRKIIDEGWATPIGNPQEFIRFLHAIPSSRDQDLIQKTLF